ASAFPKTNKDIRFDLVSLPDHTFGRTRAGLTILSCAGIAVWLIGCVNLANLLMARGLASQREFSVRLALGATRRDLARPIFIESALLSVAGGTVGLVAAIWIIELTRRFGPEGVPFLREVAFDWIGVMFSIFLSFVTALVFSLGPAIRHSRIAAMEALRASAHTSAPPEVRRMQQRLVIAQIAVALTLLLCAGLLVESFRRLWGLNLGYNPRSVVAVDML